MQDLVSETRALCAQPPSASRDAALSALFCFNSRQELEHCGAWSYLVQHLAREGRQATTWSASDWYGVRRGRPFGLARHGHIDLSGERWVRDEVVDDCIARTWSEPVYALDLSGLGENLSRVAMEILACADLSSLIWLDLSWGKISGALWHMITQECALPALRSLELRGHQESAMLKFDRAEELSSALVHLGLAHGAVDERWLRDQVRAEVFSSLRSLDLSHTSIKQGVWEVLGERQGFESMYALRLQGSPLGVRDLECLRWLPCIRTLDTLSLDLVPQNPGARLASEAILDLFHDDVVQACDLGLSLAWLDASAQLEALEALAQSHCYRHLCCLELDGVRWSEEALDALQISVLEDGSEPLCSLTLGHPVLLGECDWSIHLEGERVEQRLCAWARMSQIEELTLHVPPRMRWQPGQERHFYEQLALALEMECAWLHVLRGCAKTLRSVALGNLSAVALANFWRSWSRGERFAQIERLTLHQVEFNPRYFHREEDGLDEAPSRVVFSGGRQDIEAAYLLSLCDVVKPYTALARWFARQDLAALERDALSVDTQGIHDDFH